MSLVYCQADADKSEQKKRGQLHQSSDRRQSSVEQKHVSVITLQISAGVSPLSIHLFNKLKYEEGWPFQLFNSLLILFSRKPSAFDWGASLKATTVCFTTGILKHYLINIIKI